MRVWLIGLLAACGPGLAAQNTSATPPPVRAGVPPPSDEAGFRKLLVGEVANGGLRFTDATCQARFGASGIVAPAAFDDFARCVAGLHLHPSGREDALDDTSVLTDDNGFEIEARVAGGRLDFIGFSGRAPDLATITPETLERLRISGDRNATISDEVAREVVVPKSPEPIHSEFLRLCFGESGELTAVAPAKTTSPESAKAFADVARGWKFRPFVVGGAPLAVCAIVGFQYPATPRERHRLPRPPLLSKAGHVVYNVKPRELQKLRLAGDITIVPDDLDKIHLNGKRLIGSFKLCLDETGHYESGILLTSTGVPRYDAKIARTMMNEWVYRPYLVDGVAIPVCSAFTFIYSQN